VRFILIVPLLNARVQSKRVPKHPREGHTFGYHDNVRASLLGLGKLSTHPMFLQSLFTLKIIGAAMLAAVLLRILWRMFLG
jgi:hypothetical protein